MRQEGQRYYCLSCPTPPPRLCLLCGEKAVRANGLCHTHGERWRRWGKPPIEEWIAAFRAGTLNTCAECGRQWNGYHGCRHCSAECLTAWKRKAALAHWHARTPESKEVAKQRSLERARERRQAKRVAKVCRVCGKEFLGYPPEVTCKSRKCQSKNVTINSRAHRQRAAVHQLHEIQQEIERRLDDVAQQHGSDHAND